jgi:hypothetical protein
MKNRILQLGFVAFIALLVTACSVPDYRPWTIGGGYRDDALPDFGPPGWVPFGGISSCRRSGT